MKHFINYIVVIFFLVGNISRSQNGRDGLKNSIIIENQDFSLVVGSNGKALSLKHKATGQECLQEGINLSMFAVTQFRPYRSEHALVLPSKPTSFYGDSVYRNGDNLIVHFSETGYVATIGLKITDSYIGFKLRSIELGEIETFYKRPVYVDEFTLLQLPVRDRKFFGEWLNVSWDEDVAVNLLATDPYCRIDNDKVSYVGDGSHIMKAGMEKNVKLFDVGAALITTSKDRLFDCINQLEKDYGLPRGVKNRRSKEGKYSYFWPGHVTPENIDEYLLHAKQGGFKAFIIPYTHFSYGPGHFAWRPEYPNGIKDIKEMVKKIEGAGMIPGIHIHYNKAGKADQYVTPVPDPRLGFTKFFTLAAPVDKSSTTITVEENPEGCTMSDRMRILKIGNELVEYESFTTTFPYQFKGCERGILSSGIDDHPKGIKFELLNVDDQPGFIRFDQNTSIQKEAAKRIAGIYNEAGFRFLYFDGAEDVHPPYWYHVSNAQWEVYKLLEPEPLFAQSAAKSHFGWHMISMANAYDIFPAETFKRRTKLWKVRDAKYYVADFTNNNFGWNGYFLPDEKTIGTQPDMYEYVSCQATAWGAPMSFRASLEALKAHPRTPDNLEVMRRWEEAKLKDFLSEGQKAAMKSNPDQEYILLIDESGNFELQPYNQIQEVAQGNVHIRAFSFQHRNKSYVVYWHTSGEEEMALSLNADKVRLYKQLGEELPLIGTNEGVIVPVGGRLYLKTDFDTETLITAFKNAKVLENE